MALTQLTNDLSIIQSLSDQPSLTAFELKQKFDESSNVIKTYINETLTDEVDALIANLNDLINSLTDEKQSIISGVSDTEISYLDGVTSSIQTQLNGKQKIITSGDTDPSGGSDGDIYLRYS